MAIARSIGDIIGKTAREGLEGAVGKRATNKVINSKGVSLAESKMNTALRDNIDNSFNVRPKLKGQTRRFKESSLNDVFNSKESIAQQDFARTGYKRNGSLIDNRGSHKPRSFNRAVDEAPNPRIQELRESLQKKASANVDETVSREFSGKNPDQSKIDESIRQHRTAYGSGVNSNNSPYESRKTRNKSMSMEDRNARESAGRQRSEDARRERVRSEEGKKNFSNKTIKEQNATAGATAASDTKKNKAKDFFNKTNIQKGVGLGVGGALVFSMFDKGGQMSNSELYGQQQPYGY